MVPLLPQEALRCDSMPINKKQLIKINRPYGLFIVLLGILFALVFDFMSSPGRDNDEFSIDKLLILRDANESLNPQQINDLEEIMAVLAACSGNSSVHMEDAEKAKELFFYLLPAVNDDELKNFRWELGVDYAAKGMVFFSAYLKETIETSPEKILFCHIIYYSDSPSGYGWENFEEFPGMGFDDDQYSILVGRVEIRTVVLHSNYQNSKTIKSVLRKFNLELIKQL